MGNNKKHKSKKHKSHSYNIEERGISDGMKVILRVPPPMSKDQSLLIKYPLETIAQAHLQTQDVHKSHRSKKSKKKNRLSPYPPPLATNVLQAAGLVDISDDEEDAETSMEFDGRDYHQLSEALPHSRHAHNTILPEETEVNSKSLKVEIDLEKITLSKQPLSSYGSPHSLKAQKTIGESTPIQLIPTELTTPPIVQASPTIPLHSEKKRKKKKKKHKHRRHHETPPTSSKEKYIEPHEEKMEWEKPVSPASMGQAPSPYEVASIEEPPTKITITEETPSYLDEDEMTKDSDSFSLKPSFNLSPSGSFISVHSPSSTCSSSQLTGLKLPRTALKLFLRHLHSQICRNDPEGVFTEPVTDEIAPGYSQIIKQPMDLQTMGHKIENSEYPTVKEFKEDFTLMCNNAMTYNSPETLYYQSAKKLLNFGLRMIQKEVSFRPDIRHGLIPTLSSPQPPSSVSTTTSYSLDYSSPYICKIDINLLQKQSTSPSINEDNALIDVGGGGETQTQIIEPVVDQSHLTQVQIGFDTHNPMSTMFQSGDQQVEEEEEDILTQVDEATEILRETMIDHVPAELSFLSQGEDGKTSLHILNPHSVSSCPVNLTSLSEKIRAGQSASTVLNSELPVFKATPVSYLMYGPFGSFAPTYDTAFATLTKNDSALLLSTYGSEQGVSYANSLQQFVKGCGSFATEMGDAILNSLTNGRHAKFMETLRQKEEKESKPIKATIKEEIQSSEKEKEKVDEIKVEEESEEKERINDKEDIDMETQSHHSIEQDGEEDSIPVEESPGIPETQSDINNGMEHTSQLIVSLEEQQKQRLAHPPTLESSSGHFGLSSPSEQEIDTATQITSELVSLASKVKPGDLVSVTSLQNAMGVRQHPSSGTPTLPLPLPVTSSADTLNIS